MGMDTTTTKPTEFRPSICPNGDAADGIVKWAEEAGYATKGPFRQDESLKFIPLDFEASGGEGGQTMRIVRMIQGMLDCPKAVPEKFAEKSRDDAEIER